MEPSRTLDTKEGEKRCWLLLIQWISGGLSIEPYILQISWSLSVKISNLKMIIDRQTGQNAAVTLRYPSTMFRPTWCMFLSTSSITSGQLSLSLDAEWWCWLWIINTLWHNMAHYGTIWHNMAQYGTIWWLLPIKVITTDNIAGQSGQGRNQTLFSFEVHCDPGGASDWDIKSKAFLCAVFDPEWQITDTTINLNLSWDQMNWK